MLQRQPNSFLSFITTSLVLAFGCTSQSHVGGTNDGLTLCEASACGDMDRLPAIACADGDGSWECAREAGDCGWTLVCPNQPVEDCRPADCGDAVPAIACADGSTNFICERGGDGTCRFQLQCNDLGACNPNDCPPAQPAIACAEGGDNWVCERNFVNGECGWDLQCGDTTVTPPSGGGDDNDPNGDDPNGDGTPGSTPANPGGDDDDPDGDGTPGSTPSNPGGDDNGDDDDGDGTSSSPPNGDNPGSGNVICERSECPDVMPAIGFVCDRGEPAGFECFRDSRGVCEWAPVCAL